MVMGEQQLIDADCRQKHGAVVVQAPMPNAVVQFDQVFETRVERFGADAAAGIKRTATTRAEEAATIVTQATMILPLARFAVVRLTHLARLRARNLRADKPTTATAAIVPFHGLSDRVAIVAGIGQDELRGSWQDRNLLQNRL